MKIGLWSVKSKGNIREIFSVLMSGNHEERKLSKLLD